MEIKLIYNKIIEKFKLFHELESTRKNYDWFWGHSAYQILNRLPEYKMRDFYEVISRSIDAVEVKSTETVCNTTIRQCKDLLTKFGNE